MKKFILLAAASLMVSGAAIAHEGKDCCKGKDKKECSKEVAAKKADCGEKATAGGGSCCQKKTAKAKKDGEMTAANTEIQAEKVEATQK